MLKPYRDEYEQQMRAFYANLSEKDRRRYAALEARKLPYGGISYLCRVLGCDPKTIGRGLAELDELEDTSSGGGAHSKNRRRPETRLGDD